MASAPGKVTREQVLLRGAGLALGTTALAHLLPLPSSTHARIATASLLVLQIIFFAAVVRAYRTTSGIDRAAWGAMLASRVLVIALVALDADAASHLDDPWLPLGFMFGPVSAVLGLVAMVVLTRQVVRDTHRSGLALDAAWLGFAALAIIWPTVIEPGLGIDTHVLNMVVIVSQGTLAALTIGLGAALALRTSARTRITVVELAAGFVALRVMNLWFHQGWIGDGVDTSADATPILHLCYFVAGWAVLRTPHRIAAVRPGQPGDSAMVAATWIPIALLMGSIALHGFEVDAHWWAVIGTAAIILATRLTVELRRNSRLARQLFREATHDALTGLPNRGGIDARLEHVRDDVSAVMLVDLDRFKAVNDQLGHLAGDEVLKRAGARLRSTLDDRVWTVARVGGDEFVAMSSSDVRTDEVADTARELVDQLARPYGLDGCEAWIGATVGAATVASGLRSEELQAAADLALRDAKHQGRGSVVIADDHIRARAMSLANLAEDLDLALERDAFFCVYQPQVDLESGEVVGVEALSRWRHPERGVLAPDQFLDLAESTGRIARIDELALERTVAQLASWNATPRVVPLRASVNMSAWQLARGDVADSVAATIARYDVDPGLVTIELTETVLIDNPTVVSGRLEALRATGVSISVDDFGAGFTSIAHLRQFPISEVKIDRSLVAALDVADPTGSVPASVIALARSLGLAVVAEGIETPAQARAIRSLGCPVAQGTLFSGPVTPEHIAALLSRPSVFASPVGAAAHPAAPSPLPA